MPPYDDESEVFMRPAQAALNAQRVAMLKRMEKRNSNEESSPTMTVTTKSLRNISDSINGPSFAKKISESDLNVLPKIHSQTEERPSLIRRLSSDPEFIYHTRKTPSLIRKLGPQSKVASTRRNSMPPCTLAPTILMHMSKNESEQKIKKERRRSLMLPQRTSTLLQNTDAEDPKEAGDDLPSNDPIPTQPIQRRHSVLGVPSSATNCTAEEKKEVRKKSVTFGPDTSVTFLKMW